jgi:formate dehydrogenase-N alpha subunit
MTNSWIDIVNTDLVVVIGANPAENHTLAFKWALRARDKGAKIICADPRVTRTSALADLYVPLRSGTDIALVNAVINYALTKDLVNKDYILTHTNASFLVNPEFAYGDGLFGEIKESKYTKEKWGFQTDDAGIIKKDPTLEDPNCVYQVIKRHFARYTVEQASQVTGTPPAKILKFAEMFCETVSPEKSAVILYAMGATQSTHGVQNIRSYAILQLLMGNIGVAGGGIDAMRGESNVQGSTDQGLLFHLLTSYMASPTADDADLKTYTEKYGSLSKDPRSANWWQNYPKYIVSMLKAWYGDTATKDNDFNYQYLPKRGGNYSHIALFEAMSKGKLEGLILMGQNPAVGGPDCRHEREALGKLKWMVAADLWETETMDFWKRPGVNPAEIQTEVFMLPACSSMEKEGSVSNSGRWIQWRYAAIKPIGDSKPDLWIVSQFCQAVKKLYAKGGSFPDPVINLTWNFGAGEEPDPALVAKEMNGKFLADTVFKDKQFKAGQQVPSFAALAADGSTACGVWVHAGSFTEAGNIMAKRERSTLDKDPLRLHPNWAFAWPVNRRILYNRASCNAKGEPYAPKKAVIKWDAEGKKWVGDVADGPWPPLQNPDGTDNPEGRYSYIMTKEGHGCLFAPTLEDGPLPEHYEPLESPTMNAFSKQQVNPISKVWRPDDTGTSDKYPIVATTYRVAEHWQAGAMTRNLPWLVELQPHPFVEMSRELAAEKGVKNGDMVTVSNKRGSITMHALVTPRFKPFQVNGKKVHEVGIIWHFGYAGMAPGDSANELTPLVGDANTTIPEFKAFLCDLVKAEKGGAL